MLSLGIASAHASAFRVSPAAAAMSLLYREREEEAISTGEAMLNEVGDERSSRIVNIGLGLRIAGRHRTRTRQGHQRYSHDTNQRGSIGPDMIPSSLVRTLGAYTCP